MEQKNSRDQGQGIKGNWRVSAKHFQNNLKERGSFLARLSGCHRPENTRAISVISDNQRETSPLCWSPHEAHKLVSGCFDQADKNLIEIAMMPFSDIKSSKNKEIWLRLKAHQDAQRAEDLRERVAAKKKTQ